MRDLQWYILDIFHENPARVIISIISISFSLSIINCT